MALYHSARGSVNYTIVGSPTIVDGVVSNFNASNYLKFNSQTFSPGSGPFEIQLDYTTGNSGASYGYSLCLPCINVNQPGGVGNFRINITTTTETFYLRTERLANTKYVLKVTYDGNGLYSLYSNGVLVDSRSSTQLNTTSDGFDYTIGIREDSVGAKIDLKNTYITVNGQPWFGICPIEVKKHQLQGPVGYTVTGSPTITDGVASGFSLIDYCKLNEVFVPGNNVWEEQIKFKLSYPGSNILQALQNETKGDFRGIKLEIETNSSSTINIKNNLSSNGTSWNIVTGRTSGIPFDYSKWGYILVKFTGTQYIYQFKQEGGEYTTIQTVNNSSAIYQSDTNTGMSIGCDMSSGPSWVSYFRGEIDLNETYIKVNGKLWFWQPRETEKIVVNGVQVWQKSS